GGSHVFALQAGQRRVAVQDEAQSGAVAASGIQVVEAAAGGMQCPQFVGGDQQSDIGQRYEAEIHCRAHVRQVQDHHFVALAPEGAQFASELAADFGAGGGIQ